MNLEKYQDPLVIQKVLNFKTVAMPGLSDNDLRASNFVGRYLQRNGYRVIPVNPREEEILGEKSYPSLVDIPDPVDIVDVFRAPNAAPGIAEEAVAIKAKCIWFQFGIISEEAIKIAEEGGLIVIVDRCLKVEHARFRGRMHWLGLNTNRISAQRA